MFLFDFATGILYVVLMSSDKKIYLHLLADFTNQFIEVRLSRMSLGYKGLEQLIMQPFTLKTKAWGDDSFKPTYLLRR